MRLIRKKVVKESVQRIIQDFFKWIFVDEKYG